MAFAKEFNAMPQAKVYYKSTPLGTCLCVMNEPVSKETNMQLVVKRNAQNIFEGNVQVNKIKRSFKELAEFLFRECSFPVRCFLMTGTGLVPPDNFTFAKR